MQAFHRVVPLEFDLPPEARAAAERGGPAVASKRFGRVVGVTARFESKVGGGGHICFVADDEPDADQRLVLEPSMRGLTAVGWIVDFDYRYEDDACRAVVADWLKDVLGIVAEVRAAGGSRR